MIHGKSHAWESQMLLQQPPNNPRAAGLGSSGLGSLIRVVTAAAAGDDCRFWYANTPKATAAAAAAAGRKGMKVERRKSRLKGVEAAAAGRRRKM